MTVKRKELSPDIVYGIFDLDGTLSDIGERAIYAVAGDWEEFNSRCAHDKPISSMVLICNSWAEMKGNGVIILTGRNDKWRDQTKYWLELWNVKYDRLIMRPFSDRRSDHVFKREVVQELKELGIEIAFAFDDREHCIEMFREEGITCFKAGESVY